MKYRVLRPEFAKTGEFAPDGRPFFRVKSWTVLGFATNMADAKRFTPAPVLEAA